MRRAYNDGSWEKARRYAFQILDQPKETQLARSVIIRSFWNQENTTEVIRLNSLWDNEFDELSLKAEYVLQKGESPNSEIHHPRILKLHKNQIRPQNEQKQWNDEDIVDNFWQEGSRVWMLHPHGWTFWDMPGNFSLSTTHPDLLRLTAEVLLYPWQKSTLQSFEGTRKLGSLPALAFSAGTDSTAAALVMPEETILGYHRRNFESILDHRNADKLLEHMKRDRGKQVVDISSNHELIRTYYHKQIGFSSDFASGTHLILLADHFDIGAIAFGTPLDNTWLSKGRKFRKFEDTRYFKYWTERFLSAGIELFLPIAGISEAGAIKICQDSEILPYLNSCLRGDGKKGCEGCWKCFLKNGPIGRPFDIQANEIQTFLRRKPLPTATHALWVLQQLNLESEILELSTFLESDLSWWTSSYPPAKEIIPLRWREETWKKIHQYLAPLVEPYPIESINLYDE
tara:strand:+ start:609 stop:1979 length:1371 start_codon:yes stop_codon:yes gene_type:complete